ncbi:MAG: glucosyltransferase domain-containing protein [Candidatus Saccharibacteria bacterium]|nr:glucosyltransferase domain-containing protein [Candidatus Saccharibacteria bacterium]
MLSKLFKKFGREDKYILATVFIVGIINNFYFLISNGLSPDALSANHTHIADLWETQLGRFSLQIFDNARFGFVNQLIVIVFSLLCISGAMFLIRRTFKIKNLPLLLILSALITVAPQFTETYMYLYCADSYLFAFFLAALAVFSMSKIDKLKNSKRSYLLAIISSALLCSLYQAYLGVLVGLVIAFALYEVITSDFKSAFKHFLRNLILVGIGVVGYYVVFRIICKLNHTKPSAYKGANALGLETLRALPANLGGAFTDFYNFFFGDKSIINNSFYGRQIIYLFLALFSALGIFTVLKSEKREKIIKIVSVVILLLIFPLGVNIMNLIASGTRINLVTGPGIIVTAVLFVVILNTLPKNLFTKALDLGSKTALIVLAWTFLLSNIATYVVREDEYQEFKTISSDIYTKATSLEGYKSNMPFLFSYLIDTTTSEVDRTNGMVTLNNISWVAYAGVQRYVSFYQKYYGKNIEPADAETYEKIVKTDEFKNMSVYPDAGSIKIIDETVVIKTAEENYLLEDGSVRLW